VDLVALHLCKRIIAHQKDARQRYSPNCYASAGPHCPSPNVFFPSQQREIRAGAWSRLSLITRVLDLQPRRAPEQYLVACGIIALSPAQQKCFLALKFQL
jgi:hypothetical protein